MQMTKYRRKPIVVRAMQWRNDTMLMKDVLDFIGGLKAGQRVGRKNGQLFITTRLGDETVSDKDYIVMESQGEISICKPDIFEATYDKEEA